MVPSSHVAYPGGHAATRKGASVDDEFRALTRTASIDAALSTAAEAGAEHADVRVHRLHEQNIRLRDGRVRSVDTSSMLGLAVRVIVDGTWGFAGHTAVNPETAARTARRAVEVATRLHELNRERIELADEPIYCDAEWVGGYHIDPFTVPDRDKVALLLEYSGRLADADGVDHVTASLVQVKEQTFYADSCGSSIIQQRVRTHPVFEAIHVNHSGGGFETMRTTAAPSARGWEYVTGADGVWNHEQELNRMPEWLAQKARASSVTPGVTDLVIDPTNLWLTIHESIGHATEFDRAIGYESAYAGTSFATPDQLGTLRYGSPVMHVTADRTEEFGLATIGYDDDGVAGQRWDLIRNGILVGYQLDRVFARRLGLERSNGCAYADSPHHVPIQRMANVSLQPDDDHDTTTEELIERVDNGIYIVGDKSWSIDMQRYNFQFTGQRFYRIRNGRIDGQLRNVAYQATTTDFWTAMEAVGGRSTWHLGGAMNCGKAQPGQIAAVSHGCPSVLVRGVNVLDVGASGGGR